MMYVKAIWKYVIGKIAKVSRSITPEPHKDGLTAPYMSPQLQGLMCWLKLCYGLWP